MTNFEEAICFAVAAHQGARRKGETTPYILHPMEAASICATVTSDQDVLTAAVLHDTVEDTDVTLAQIAERFGARVAQLGDGGQTPGDAPGRELAASEAGDSRASEKRGGSRGKGVVAGR